MTLRLYNTLTRTKEDFVPLDPTNVRMYVCGPTVYDYAHIGNARPAIVFDVLYRLLRHLYGEAHVTYVRNITDVDDKINARAAAEGISIGELTAETAKIYDADMAALGNLAPTHAPRATQHIPQMIRMIEALIASGHAYAAEGHVLFDVSSKADYGKLARRSVDDMIAGARVDPAPYKRNPMDFVLWKPSDEKTPGWNSPWGFGRPGWHLECSAMSAEYLGETFDIHGGGIDLVFPHHENEIAQSECTHHGHPIARVWMHNGHLNVEGAKMSKSLGNFVTVHDLLKDWPGDVLRLQMLMTHYTQPLDWTRTGTLAAQQKIEAWFTAAMRSRPRDTVAVPDKELADILSEDLNTPQAITYLDKLSEPAQRNDVDSQRFTNNVVFLGIFRDFKREIEPLVRNADPKFVDEINQLSATEWLRRLDLKLEKYREILGAREVWLKFYDLRRPIAEIFSIRDVSSINAAIEARAVAKKTKNFAESDRIRDELDAKGIVLKDNKDGTTTWEVKR